MKVKAVSHEPMSRLRGPRPSGRGGGQSSGPTSDPWAPTYVAAFVNSPVYSDATRVVKARGAFCSCFALHIGFKVNYTIMSIGEVPCEGVKVLRLSPRVTQGVGPPGNPERPMHYPERGAGEQG
ncbi:hypothetical protein SE86_03740 [Acidilobus sp. 7A]|nr:hypothetical protein SE86_03740 [Acidilobus sp. 7A]